MDKPGGWWCAPAYSGVPVYFGLCWLMAESAPNWRARGGWRAGRGDYRNEHPAEISLVGGACHAAPARMTLRCGFVEIPNTQVAFGGPLRLRFR